MRDLRIYVDPLSAGAHGESTTFYSQRADGPYYRWLYEGECRRWRFSRVRPSKPTLRVLRVAGWNAVPPSLRAELGDHYLE